MGQQEELEVMLKPPAAMVFSWSPSPPSRPPRAEALPPERPTKKKTAGAPQPQPAAARRLSVPPPPGRAAATRSLSSRGRAVRPEDDPFLAAYMACTKSSRGGGGAPTGEEANKQQGRSGSRFAWARLGLSCKSSAAVIERTMVKVAKRPERDPRE